MIAKSYIASDIKWDVTVDDGINAFFQMDPEEASIYLGLPADEIDAMTDDVYFPLCEQIITENPEILTEIYELPTEVVIPSELFEGIDNPEDEQEIAVEYLEDKYNFSVNQYSFTVG